MYRILLCLIWLLPAISYGQYYQNDKGTLFLKLVTKEKKPLAHTSVWLVEKGTDHRMDSRTNAEGKADFEIALGKSYSIHITAAEALEEVNFPASGTHTFIKTIECSPPPPSASATLPMDTIEMKLPRKPKPGQREALLSIGFMQARRQKAVYTGLDVYLTDSALRKVYKATTGKDGKAVFLLPSGRKYIAGAGSAPRLGEVELPYSDELIANFDFTYIPTVVSETVVNDTIRQQLPPSPGPTSDRAYLHISVSDLDNRPLPDEVVVIKQESGPAAYKAVTNEWGIAEFLIPKGCDYTVNLKYSFNIQLIKIPHSNSLRRTTITISYRGSKYIEEFYARAGRDANGNQVEFMTSKVKAIDTKPKIERTSLGYNIVMPEHHGPTTSPTLFGDKIFVNGGYYSSELYGLKGENGEWMWTTELMEGGASPVVYDNGVVLVNTESCSLYALDAESGRLIWSKWLSPYLLTTPSVANGKVYTVYGSDLARPSITNGNYVMICIDIPTGKIEWQQRIHAEAVASPVIENGRVYVTTMNGKLHALDAAKGTPLAVADINATTPPLVVKDQVFISRRKSGKDKNEFVSVLDAKDLAVQKDLTGLSGTCSFDSLAYVEHPCEAMNFSGSRMLHYKGRNYNVMDNRLYCTDGESGNILWKQDLDEEASSGNQMAQTPVLAGSALVVTTAGGKIKVFDAASGTMTNEYSFDDAAWNQPVVHNGWIYAATRKGKVLSVNTKNKRLTGWSMWGGNSRHNPVVTQ